MSFRRSPFFDLRDWWVSDPRLRELLRVDELGYAPFFPIQQQPESTEPFIVYKFEKYSEPEAWWIHYDLIFMEIYFTDFQDGYEIVSLMIDKANKGAISARDLTHFLKEEGKPLDFEYHVVEYIEGGRPDPSKEQGGDMKIQAAFSIAYSPLKGSYIT
jgi:hypothetical protein